MKFIKHNIDFSIMSQEELSYANGYNAGIAHCEKVLAERKQLKKDRKALKEKGLFNKLKKGLRDAPIMNEFTGTTLLPLPTRYDLLEKKAMELETRLEKFGKNLDELEKHIIDVDETAGERFKEIFDILAVHSKKLYDIENPSGLKKEPDGVHRY